MDPTARLQVNLNVLRKHDPSITEIIDRCSHVVVYGFREPVKWTKSNIEGTLFLFKRSKAPAYGFFIMNRLGVENVMCFLTENVELQITPEYIIYRADQAIQPDGNLVYGLWVFESDDRDRVAKKLVNLKSISTQTTTSTPMKDSSPTSSSSASGNKSSGNAQNVDVVGLLQKAFDAHGVKNAAPPSGVRSSTSGNNSQAKNPPSQQASLLKQGVDLDGKFLLSLIQPEGKIESSVAPTSGSNAVQARKKQEKLSEEKSKSSKEKLSSSEEPRKSAQSGPRNSKYATSSNSATPIANRTSQQPASSSVPSKLHPPQMPPNSKKSSKQDHQEEQVRPSQRRQPIPSQQETTTSDDQTMRPSHPPGLSQRTEHALLEQPTQPSGSGSQIPQQNPPIQMQPLPPHPIFPIPFPPPGSPHMMPFPPGPFPMLPPGTLLYPPHAAAAAGTAFAARYYGNPGGGPISKDEFVGALFNLMQNDSLFMNFAYQTYLNSPKP